MSIKLVNCELYNTGGGPVPSGITTPSNILYKKDGDPMRPTPMDASYYAKYGNNTVELTDYMSAWEIVGDMFSFEGVSGHRYGGRLIIDGATIYDETRATSIPSYNWTPVDGAVITFSQWTDYDSGVTLTQIEIVTSPAPSGYTISYSTVHGTAPSPVSDVAELTSAMLPTLSATGYTFQGWFYESTFTTQAQAGDTISADTTLYAKWGIRTYTYYYRKNDGTTDYVTQTKTRGTPVTLYGADTFTREGYTLKEWNEEADGSGLSWALGAECGVESQFNLYAMWQEQTSCTLDVVYNSQKIIDSLEVTPPVAVTYNGSTIATLNAGDTKTLDILGSDNKPKILATPIVIGGKTIPDVDALGRKWVFEHNLVVEVGGVTPIPDVLNDASWAQISAVAAAGQAANYWSVGDVKMIHVQGTVGTLSVNQDFGVYIIGFDHNGATNTVDFGTFKTALTGGAGICLCDSKYGNNSSDGTKYFNLSHWGGYSSPRNTNYGGWKGCDARYDVLGSTNQAPSDYGSTPTTSRVGYDATATTATSPVANTLMAALPSDLRAVMKPMTIYTDNKGNSSNIEANVTTSIDYLPLLSEFEIFGTRSYANQYEQNQQARYQYYKDGNSRVKFKHSNVSSTAAWWERSSNYNDASSFCLVTTSATAYNSYSNTSGGIAPAFRV